MLKNDKLDLIFKKQKYLQKKFGHEFKKEFDIEYFSMIILSLISELMECLGETKWKLWKKKQVHNKIKLKEEIIDVWFFLISLSLEAGISSDELFLLFQEKYLINLQRIKEGY